jgi:hypothetical protein
MSVSEKLPKRPNLVLILSDQERATQHFPPGWERRNLHNLTRLKDHQPGVL